MDAFEPKLALGTESRQGRSGNLRVLARRESIIKQAQYTACRDRRRFGKRPNGPGLGLGIGYFSGGGASATTFPLSINYLIGKRNHFLELGGGATFTTGRIDFADIDVSGDFFFYHLNAGYRYQPSAGGFFLRAGISPLFFRDSRDMTSYYLGLGYSF